MSDKYEDTTAFQSTAPLTQEQKSDPMVQPAIYNTAGLLMRSHDCGSRLIKDGTPLPDGLQYGPP